MSLRFVSYRMPLRNLQILCHRYFSVQVLFVSFILDFHYTLLAQAPQFLNMDHTQEKFSAGGLMTVAPLQTPIAQETRLDQSRYLSRKERQMPPRRLASTPSMPTLRFIEM